MAADRDLLLGLLALQNGLISRDQLVSAFALWTGASKKPMAEVLAEMGALPAPQRALLDALVEAHLKLHGGDAEKSLAALELNRSTRDRLAAAGGPEVEATLAHVISPSNGQADHDQTASYSVGAATSDGQRFRVLRPHARGGLGAVFVALDGELHREVALKQILDHHADDPGSRRRFLVEAEITGGLEHPGIVPVYGLGTYGDGRPYYAMRFIRGDSLKDAIEQFHADAALKSDPGRSASGGLELRKLLRRFTDVCNAIDYAHSRGVLHRDIKPGNVIVGKHGETLVVDWGLARAQGRHDGPSTSEERTLVPSSASGSAETLPGQALGTPAYMSPEQARGDLDGLGPCSDVYSLGATLYCVLTGKPPYQGQVGEVLQAVQRGGYAPPRRLDPSIDPALEAVCKKAMATRPEERYATCRALADDVERWLADEPVDAYDEPWTRTLIRWLIRHRTGVTAAAAALLVGLVGLASVAAVQTKARTDLDHKNRDLTAANTALDLQRRRAETNEAEAINAVRRFRDAVIENPELKNTPALEGLRKSLLKEPLAFFRGMRARFQADRSTQPAALAQLAEVIHDYAHLTDEIGDKRDGLKAHDDTLAIWQGLTRDDPANSKYQAGLATIENCRGIFLEATGKPTDALAAYEQARAVWERLVRENPSVTEFQSGLAASHHNIGILLSATAKPSEALAAHQQARAIFERLARENPSVIEFQRRLAASHNSTGSVLGRTAKPSEALAAYEQARAIRERLARENPSVTEFQSRLADSHNNIGLLLNATGKPLEALAAYEQARAIKERLVRENPSVTEFQSRLSDSHHNIGLLLSDTGKPLEALAAYEQARAIKQRLVRENPSVTEFQSGLAVSHNNIGNLLSDIGKPSEALAAYEQARAMQERLARENPSVTEFQSGLADSHNSIGSLLAETGKPSEALAAYEQARAIQERLARENPSVTEFQNDLAASNNNMGALLSDTGKPSEALAAYERARAIFERLARENPSVTEFQSRLAGSYYNIAILLSDTGKPSEALAAYEQARAIQERLVREHPESPAFASALGGTLHNLATLDLVAKRFAAARDKLNAAIGWQKKALAAYPRHPEFRRFLANHLTNLLHAALGLGDSALAAEARRGLDELQASDPRVKDLDARLTALRAGEAPRDNAERLALAQRAYDTQRHATAARLWAEAFDSDPELAENRRTQHRYSAACAAALGAAGQGRNDEPAPDADAKTRLRQQALGWLKSELTAWEKLIEKGPDQARAFVAATLRHWRADTDLAGVREPEAMAKLPDHERNDWQALWAEVDAQLHRAEVAGAQKLAPRPGELPANALAPLNP